MTPEKLHEAIKGNNPPLVIDVRTSLEYRSGCVPSAIHMSFITSPIAAFKLNKDKSKTVVLYCEHGPRAYFAALFLKLAGFKNIEILKGHMHAWRKQNLPLG